MKAISISRPAALLFLAAALLALLGTCDLFKVGFGDRIDLKDPVATSRNYVNGDYVRGTLVLEGDTTDDVGAMEVQVKPGNGTWVKATMGEEGAWSVSIDTTRLPDGETIFLLKATDAFPRSSEKQLFLYVDNTEPVVLIKNPVFNQLAYASMSVAQRSAAFRYNQRVTISGGAADNMRLRRVTATLYRLLDNTVLNTVLVENQFDWSASFTPDPGTELTDYIVSVTGTDYAGNVSTRFYTAADIRTISGVTEVPPADELVRIEGGETIGGISPGLLLPKARAAGTGSNQFALIDPDSDKPQFIISNPSEEGDETSNILSPLSRVVGMVLDDDGVDTAGIRIRSRAGLVPWDQEDDTGWVPVSKVVGSGLSVRFEHSFSPYLTVGTFLMQVSAADVNGLRSYGQPIAFRVEASASTIIFQSHRSRQFVNGEATLHIAGTASDPDGIDRVEILFDSPSQVFHDAVGTQSWDYTSTVPAGDLYWTSPGVGLYGAWEKGELPVVVRVTDSTGQVTSDLLVLLVDMTPPSVSVYTPSSSALLNGAVVIKGSAGDNTALASVGYRMGKDTDGPDNIAGNADDWQSFSSLYEWQLSIPNVDIYASGTYSDWDSATETWDFVFHVRAVDNAGNETIYDHPLILDPAGDSPRVSVLQPGENAIVGGTIRIIGTAIDDDAVDLVQVRINRNAGFSTGPVSDTDFTDVTDFWDGTEDGSDGDTDDLWEDESVWVDATPSSAGNWSNWYLVINAAKEFNTDGETDPRWIQLQIRSRDINGKYGSPSPWSLRVDSRIPAIEFLSVDTDAAAASSPDSSWGTAYTQGMLARGQIWLRSLIRDQGGFSPTGKIEIEWDSPSLPADRIDDEAAKTTDDGIVAGGYDQYRMHLPIDSTAAGFFPNATGEMRLTVVAYDNSDPQFITRESVRINVDNMYPNSTYSGNATILGEEYRLAGTAADPGTVASVSSVVAYLVRGGQALAIKPGQAPGSAALVTLSALNMDGTPAVESVPFPNLADNRFFVRIDRADDLSTGNLDGDGYKENFTATAGGRDWEAFIDSTLVQDGLVDVHYVVFDHVGNAAHYQHTASVRNHPPVIGTVTLGTDLDGDGTTNDNAEERPAAFSFGASTDLATAFTARNNRLYVGIGQSEPSPNGTLSYTAMIGAVNLKPSDSSANTAEPGYSAFVADGIADASSVAVVLRVTDSLGYYDERTVRVNLDNIDDTPAQIAVAPFGWTYPNEESDADKASTVAVSAYADNIVMNGIAELGHIEYAEDSPWTNAAIGAVADNQADISGRVVFKGKAFDNQRIQSITAQIPGFDGGAGAGNAFTLASWSGGALVSANTAALDLANHWSMELPADQAYLTQAEGHVVNWNFSWDSAYITGVADDDVTLTFRVLDFGTSPAASDPITVDIVPYISAISTPKRTDGGLKDVNIRSADGKYSVIVGADATFTTVNGFNLNPNAVRLVSSTVVDDTLVTAASGVDLADSAVTAGYGSFSLSNGGTVSGYLEVFTNGQRSLNNINDNDAQGDYPDTGVTAMYNREPDLYVRKNPLLNDDRYLRFFRMRDTGVKNGYYPEMILEDDDPVFGFVRMTGGPSTAVGLAAGTGAGVYYPSHAMPQRSKFNGATAAEMTTEYLIKASIWDQMAMAKDGANRYFHATVYNRDDCAMSLIYDRYAELYADGMGWGTGVGYVGYVGNWSESGGNNAITLERTNYGGSLLLGRFQYPKLVAKGDSTTGNATLYMLYYDDNTATSDLIFRNFRIGTSVMANTLYAGGTSSDGTTGYAQYSNLADSDSAGRLTAASSASKHFDFAVTSGDRVVVLYYDEMDGQLKLRYSDAAVDGSNPTAAITWLDSAVSFPSYVGNYVSMALDANDGIHIAAYDAGESDLSYMYLSSYASTTLHAVTVDAAFAVGNWTKVKILEAVAGTYIPYIAYYNATETGGRDAIKLAYCKTGITSSNVPAGVDLSTGYATGNWEYLTVPAISPPQGGDLKFKQVNLDFDTADRPVLGYLGTNLEFGTWLSE